MNDVNQIIQQTAQAVVLELKRQGLLKENIQTPYQKTETLLYNYNNFKQVIEDKHRQIETIQEEGVPKKSSSITSFSGSPCYEIKSELEKAEDMIHAITQSIQITERFISIIDAALEAMKPDPYFDIIPMKYFEGLTREDIADHFNCDVKTISRNKSRLVNLLQIRLFSDEFIFQLFN